LSDRTGLGIVGVHVKVSGHALSLWPGADFCTEGRASEV
jgi:hypothetical protein